MSYTEDLMKKVFGEDIHTTKVVTSADVEQKNNQVVGQQVVSVNTTTGAGTSGNTKKGSHIRVVVDESGSMSSYVNAAMGGFNAFLDQQKRVDDGSLISIWKFSNTVNKTPTVVHRASLNLADPLTPNNYRPNGYTALNDAIGDAIMEDPNESNVILAILTDGQENASRRYTQPQIASMVKAQQAKGWEILFLSASDLTGAQEAKLYGLDERKVMKFAASSQGFTDVYGDLNKATTDYRNSR